MHHRMVIRRLGRENENHICPGADEVCSGNVKSDLIKCIMCFCLYLATASEPPLIPGQGYQPGTGKISTDRGRIERGQMGDVLRQKFMLPCITEVNSDVGCGCAFRYQGPGDLSTTQPNQMSLVAFLAEHCRKEPFVELYACWADCETHEVAERHEVELPELAHEEFSFWPNAYYRVWMPEKA